MSTKAMEDLLTLPESTHSGSTKFTSAVTLFPRLPARLLILLVADLVLRLSLQVFFDQSSQKKILPYAEYCAKMTNSNLPKNKHYSTLRNTGWLSTCDADFQDAFLSRGKLIGLKSGDELYREGKISRNIYGLVEGQIDVHLSSASGEALVYPFMAPGRWYGLADVVAELPAFGTAVAGRESIAFRLTKRQVNEFLDEQPDRYREIVAHEYALRRNIQETVIDLVTSDGLELVAKRLIRLMSFDGVDPSVPLNISQFEFATALGVSPPTVQRAFRELKKYGAIETSYGKVLVRDVARLNDFVSTFSD